MPFIHQVNQQTLIPGGEGKSAKIAASFQCGKSKEYTL